MIEINGGSSNKIISSMSRKIKVRIAGKDNWTKTRLQDASYSSQK